MVVGENDRSGAISQIQLGEDMVDVGLHRTFTDEELLGDLGVCAASTDQSEDVGSRSVSWSSAVGDVEAVGALR